MTAHENLQREFWDKAYSGDLNGVKAVVAKGFDFEARDDRGNTTLTKVGNFGDTRIAEFLIECGAIVNARNSYNMNALKLAVIDGHEEMVHCLLEAGATQVETDADSWPALWLAANFGGHKVAKRLLQAGADCNLKISNGELVSFLAANDRETAIPCLLASGAALYSSPETMQSLVFKA
jgi:ankyrin repeat protein